MKCLVSLLILWDLAPEPIAESCGRIQSEQSSSPFSHLPEMANVDLLVDKIKKLNEARAEGICGAQEELVETIVKLKNAVQTPFEIIWESRYQVRQFISDESPDWL